MPAVEEMGFSFFQKWGTVLLPSSQSRTFCQLKRALAMNHLSEPLPLTEEETGAQRGEVSPKVTQQLLGLAAAKNQLLICHFGFHLWEEFLGIL